MKHVCLNDIFHGLSPNKRFHNYRELWHQASDYNILTDFPLHLDIELSGKCNLCCQHCFQNGKIKGKLGFMDWRLYCRIIDEGIEKGLCAVKLQVRGESMLHPRFFDSVQYAKKAGILDVQLTTNATLMDSKSIEKTLDSGLDGIIFSLDQQHDHSYREYYRSKHYSDVEQAVFDFLKRRHERGLSSPWVRLQTSVSSMDASVLAKTKSRMRERFPEADIIAINRIQDFAEDADVFPDLHKHYDLLPCDYLMHRLAIFWNGDVTVCCVDYNNNFQIGSVHHETVQSIWLCAKMMHLRRMHRDGKRQQVALCGRCHACVRPKNDTIISDQVERHWAEHHSSVVSETEGNQNPGNY